MFLYFVDLKHVILFKKCVFYAFNRGFKLMKLLFIFSKISFEVDNLRFDVKN